MATREAMQDNGVELFRITDECDKLVSNLYCERPYCSRDSSRFLYVRETAAGGDWECVLCSFGDWDEQVVGRGRFEVSVSYNYDYYYLRHTDRAAMQFIRLDLDTGKSEVVHTFPDGIAVMRHPTVSPDQRYVAWHAPVSFDPQLFGVYLLDLQTGKTDLIATDPFLCNAHLQFCPIDPELLLVQHNLGCKFTKTGEREILTTGASLFLLDIHGRKQELPVGPPHTPGITGHEAWLGASRKIIATIGAKQDYARAPHGKGNIVVIDENLELHRLENGVQMNHIGTPPDGRYFHADMVPNDHIVIGNPKTGKTVTVTRLADDPEPAARFGQQSHPHAALMPDGKWLVFNSDRTGRPQVYAARIPAELLHTLN